MIRRVSRVASSASSGPRRGKWARAATVLLAIVGESVSTFSTRDCPFATARAATSPTKLTLDTLESSGRIVFRYATARGEITADGNPNGSERNIAGIVTSAATSSA